MDSKDTLISKLASKKHSIRGITLIELLIAITIGSMLLMALNGFVSQSLMTQQQTLPKQKLLTEANFAMNRMVHLLSQSERLVLPFFDNPNTSQKESVHYAIAVSIPKHFDRDYDGFPDADNDRDGRMDEDFGPDSNNDGSPGIKGIDDDLSGNVDEGSSWDNDEDGSTNEDSINGKDDDSDGSIDEDIWADMNADAQSGIKLIDDDLDGSIDEAFFSDDDEDGSIDEDWIDTLVYYFNGSQLIERIPDPHAAGSNFNNAVLAEGVQLFAVTRERTQDTESVPLVTLRLDLANEQGDTVSLIKTIRIGKP